MKLWEETWTVQFEGPMRAPTIEGPNGTVATVAVRYRSEGKWAVLQHADARCEADLIAAAPRMARALMALRDSGINSRTWDDTAGKVMDVRKMADEALREAGVIP